MIKRWLWVRRHPKFVVSVQARIHLKHFRQNVETLLKCGSELHFQARVPKHLRPYFRDQPLA